jgi:hypothetical protein
MAWRPKYPDPPSSGSLWFRLRKSRVAQAITQNASVAIASALIGAALCWTLLSFISWHPLQVLKHIAAFPSCDAARAVGVAPSYRGRPGYWSSTTRIMTASLARFGPDAEGKQKGRCNPQRPFARANNFSEMK